MERVTPELAVLENPLLLSCRNIIDDKPTLEKTFRRRTNVKTNVKTNVPGSIFRPDSGKVPILTFWAVTEKSWWSRFFVIDCYGSNTLPAFFRNRPKSKDQDLSGVGPKYTSGNVGFNVGFNVGSTSERLFQRWFIVDYISARQ